MRRQFGRQHFTARLHALQTLARDEATLRK